MRVVDGDTVDLLVDMGFHMQAKLRFRLMGYNAPEVRGPERVMGLEAKNNLQEVLAVGEFVTVKTYKGDAFGRWLADFEILGRDLVEMLIFQGWGVPWNGKGKRPGFSDVHTYPNPAKMELPV
jgi:micrococcal nuclease